MPSVGFSPTVIFDWLIGGVNFDLAGNGGRSCIDFTPRRRAYLEFIFFITIGAALITWAYKSCNLPECRKSTRKDRGGRKTLLAIVSLIFGMEVGYKFATKSVIFLLNPCHVITAIQIYLLAATPSRVATALFRIHLNFLNGAILALLFPVTNTLFLPLETEIYFLQHFMMLVTPYYLMRVGGAYTVEKLRDFSWTLLSFGIMICYHYLILFPIAIPLEINLSQMLCPAISDPFYGPNYRLWTLVHQSFLVPMLCKGYCQFCKYFITKCPLTRVKTDITTDLGLLTVETSKNGFVNGKSHHEHHGNCNVNITLAY